MQRRQFLASASLVAAAAATPIVGQGFPTERGA